MPVDGEINESRLHTSDPLASSRYTTPRFKKNLGKKREAAIATATATRINFRFSKHNSTLSRQRQSDRIGYYPQEFQAPLAT